MPQPLAKAEKEGAPTRLNIAKEALDDALAVSCNLRELRYRMSKRGYICQFDQNRKYWTVRQSEWKRPIRLVRMGELQKCSLAYRNEKRSNERQDLRKKSEGFGDCIIIIAICLDIIRKESGNRNSIRFRQCFGMS